MLILISNFRQLIKCKKGGNIKFKKFIKYLISTTLCHWLFAKKILLIKKDWWKLPFFRQTKKRKTKLIQFLFPFLPLISSAKIIKNFALFPKLFQLFLFLFFFLFLGKRKRTKFITAPLGAISKASAIG